MYVAINMAKKAVLYKHPSVNVVLNMVHIEVPVGECHVSAVDMCLRDKSDLDIKLIYRNTFGAEPPANARELLFDHILTMPVADVIPEEVAKLAACIGPNDKKIYKYIKGMYNGSYHNPFEEQPVLSNAPKVHAPPPPAYIPRKPGVMDTIRDDDPLPEPEPVRAPREPRAPGQSSSERPKAGSTTGRVWDIADELSAQYTDPKQLRKAVIEACVAQGINQSTASVQFGKWKASQ